MEEATEPSGVVDVLSTSFLLPNVGAPFLVGLAVGYFAKKVLRVVLLLAGVTVVLLFIVEYNGIIAVNSDGLQEAAGTAREVVQQSGCFLYDRLSRVTCQGVSAATGLLVGLRLG